MTDLLYRYPDLRLGTLLKRYKRFLADIQLDNGEIITAHCPNTGPMTGVCTLGARVGVSYHDNPKRTLAYTWEIIEVEQTWVGVNTSLPNRIVKEMLGQRLLPELGDYQSFKPEVAYGKEKSRIDFMLTYGTADHRATLFRSKKYHLDQRQFSFIPRYRNHQRTKAFKGID